MKVRQILMIALVANGVALIPFSGQLANANGDMGMSGPTSNVTPSYGGTMNVSPTWPSGTITNPAILGGTSNVSPSGIDPLSDIDIDLGAPTENVSPSAVDQLGDDIDIDL